MDSRHYLDHGAGKVMHGNDSLYSKVLKSSWRDRGLRIPKKTTGDSVFRSTSRVTSKDVRDWAKAQGIEIKSHDLVLTDDLGESGVLAHVVEREHRLPEPHVIYAHVDVSMDPDTKNYRQNHALTEEVLTEEVLTEEVWEPESEGDYFHFVLARAHPPRHYVPNFSREDIYLVKRVGTYDAKTKDIDFVSSSKKSIHNPDHQANEDGASFSSLELQGRSTNEITGEEAHGTKLHALDTDKPVLLEDGAEFAATDEAVPELDEGVVDLR
ncbi:unnamed protein product [Amoebophrya sp. A120]|nr:unnamed protein product [Amoebophrya sp. A120]|eukprot:GSA120T00020230001.1